MLKTLGVNLRTILGFGTGGGKWVLDDGNFVLTLKVATIP